MGAFHPIYSVIDFCFFSMAKFFLVGVGFIRVSVVRDHATENRVCRYSFILQSLSRQICFLTDQKVQIVNRHREKYM